LVVACVRCYLFRRVGSALLLRFDLLVFIDRGFVFSYGGAGFVGGG
jgi:hypothetical protein